MIKIEVLENKIFFRDGMRLAGPLAHDDFPNGLVRIADELRVLSVEILIVYLEHRKMEMGNDNNQEIEVFHSPDSLIPQTI